MRKLRSRKLFSLLLLFFLAVNLHALRNNSEAAWSDEYGDPQNSPLPSLQTHAGPLLFSVFSPEDLQHAPVREALTEALKTSSRRAHQKSRLRGELYRDFIMASLHERQLPGELITIVYIESAFDITAESRTGARGLWQFADNSMAPFLEASVLSPSWDERFDFWKSTDAAAEKLLYNYRETGNWLLAIGAYNGGLGRMTRAISNSGGAIARAAGSGSSAGSAFWELEQGAENNRISAETASYVPKFIATSILSMYPGRFGIMLDWAPPYNWQRIRFSGNLREFSEKTGIPLSTLIAGNAEYLDTIVPSGKHYVKFPQRYYNIVSSTITIHENNETGEHDKNGEHENHFHTVAAGDTLWNIGRRYNMSIDELRTLNDLGQNDILSIGARLVVQSF
ncbi:MAG: transglycosylase SLT domain-containing protein [Salinispira sp.]